MPLDQHLEGRHGDRESGMEIGPDLMHRLLEVADQRQHREHRLHQHAVLPPPALTPCEVGRSPCGGMEGSIAQDDHPLFKAPMSISMLALIPRRCSDLITSLALLDNMTSFLRGFIENIGGVPLTLSKNMLELSKNSLKTAACAHIPHE